MKRERLDKALHRVAREANVDELRLRNWVSFLALCGVLQRAIEEHVIANYHLKGGVRSNSASPIERAPRRTWILAYPVIAARDFSRWSVPLRSASMILPFV